MLARSAVLYGQLYRMSADMSTNRNRVMYYHDLWDAHVGGKFIDFYPLTSTI